MFGTAGLIIPCICGVFLFGETMSAMQLVGIAVFFISAWLLIQSSKQIYPHFSLKTFALLAVVLVSNGLTMLLQKYTRFGCRTAASLCSPSLHFRFQPSFYTFTHCRKKGGRGKNCAKALSLWRTRRGSSIYYQPACNLMCLAGSIRRFIHLYQRRRHNYRRNRRCSAVSGKNHVAQRSRHCARRSVTYYNQSVLMSQIKKGVV